MSKSLIDAATLREKFHYDPETGAFRRRLGSARTISDKQAGRES